MEFTRGNAMASEAKRERHAATSAAAQAAPINGASTRAAATPPVAPGAMTPSPASNGPPGPTNSPILLGQLSPGSGEPSAQLGKGRPGIHENVFVVIFPH